MGGAVVAAAAAARRQRLQRIIDAFRLADATAPERARSLDEVGAEPTNEFDTLTRAGVVVGTSGGRWYLSEAGYVAYREATSFNRRGVLMVLVLAIALIVIAAAMALKRT